MRLEPQQSRRAAALESRSHDAGARGAVHIDDVAAAVMQSLDLISRQQLNQRLTLTLDSAYEYSDADGRRNTNWKEA